MISWY